MSNYEKLDFNPKETEVWQYLKAYNSMRTPWFYKSGWDCDDGYSYDEVCDWFDLAKLIKSGKRDFYVERGKTPKPQMRVEYEKVTESIFDLKDKLERGELVFYDRDEYIGIVGEDNLCKFHADGNVFRCMEKPFDWRDEVLNYLESKEYDSDFYWDFKNNINSLTENDADLLTGLAKTIFDTKEEL